MKTLIRRILVIALLTLGTIFTLKATPVKNIIALKEKSSIAQTKLTGLLAASRHVRPL